MRAGAPGGSYGRPCQTLAVPRRCPPTAVVAVVGAIAAGAQVVEGLSNGITGWQAAWLGVTVLGAGLNTFWASNSDGLKKIPQW